MLMTIEGVYENGAVRLLEPLPGVARARVAVTVLPEAPPMQSQRKTLRQMSDAEREQYFDEMHARWQGRQSSSDEFARHKKEEIDMENRHFESDE